MATALTDFQTLQETGLNLCNQWKELVRSVQGVGALWKAKFSAGSVEPDDNLTHLAFGDAAAYRLFRLGVEAGVLVVQQNTGTDPVPVWTTIFSFTGGGFAMADGTAPSPGLAFAADLDTGFFRPAANQLGISGGGTEAMRFGAGVALAATGAAATPSIAFQAEPGLGLYRNGAGDLGFSVAGALAARLISTSFLTPPGVAATPGLGFRTDPDTGLFLQADAVIGITVAGTERHRLTAAQVLVADGLVGTPSLAFLSDPDTGLFRQGANAMGLVAAGAEVARVFAAQFGVIAGSAATPSLTFIGDPNTGLFSAGADLLGFATNGVQRAHIGANGLLLVDGAAATPAVSFISDPDTGWYRIAANHIGLATAGAALLNADSAGIAIGQGATAADASAILELESTTKGLLIPRMSSAQMAAIASAANGLLLFETTRNMFRRRRESGLDRWEPVGQPGQTSHLEADTAAFNAETEILLGGATIISYTPVDSPSDNSTIRGVIRIANDGTAGSYRIRIRSGTNGDLTDPVIYDSGNISIGASATVDHDLDLLVYPPSGATRMLISAEKSVGAGNITVRGITAGGSGGGVVRTWAERWDYIN